MSELRALIAAVRELREARQPFVSATVIAVNGSGYRKAGARMVATQDQWLAGSISGGCLERDVTNKGLWYTRGQRAWLATYDSSEDEQESGAGTGCQGIVDVLIERFDSAAPDAVDVFSAAERCLQDEVCAAIVTVVRSTRPELPLAARLILQADAWQTEYPELQRRFAEEASRALATQPLPYVLRGDEVDVLVECMQPPVHLFVFGTGHDATPLVAHAKNLGWTVSVWDASPRSSARDRFRLADHYLTGSVEEAVAAAARCVRPAAVVMGHHFARDRAALGRLLTHSPLRYIGLLGSRQRSQDMLDACREDGITLDEPTLARIQAPVGLPLGAETPAEVALAIVAQIQKAFGRSPGPRPDVRIT